MVVLVHSTFVFQNDLFPDEDGYNQPHVLAYNEVKQAAERIEGGTIHTPLCVRK